MRIAHTTLRTFAAALLAWAILGTDVVPPPVTVSAQLRAQVAFGPAPVLNPSAAAPATPLLVPYTAGTITSGGYQVNIPLGTIQLIDNQYACGAPQFAACNFIYWTPGASTLLVTNVPLIAFQNGNAVLWFISTFGGTVTNMVAWSQAADTPAGIAVTGVASTGLRAPICNALLQQACQPAVRGSLSGY
jgi:hypothetical protein